MSLATVDITSDLINTQTNVKPNTTWSHFGKLLSELTGVEVDDMKLVINGDTANSKYMHELKDQIVEGVNSIRIIDTNENSVANQLKHDMTQGDVEGVMFQFTKEDYENRKDSVLQWKKENKLGKFDPEYRKKMEEQLELNLKKVKSLENHIGERCRILSTNATNPDSTSQERRGWLRYVGKVREINNTDVWCGIEFDEPVGKNDGSFSGTKYFGPVGKNYGGFVKPITVEVGEQFTPLLDDELALTDEEL